MLQDEIEPFARWSGLIGQSLLDAEHLYPGWEPRWRLRESPASVCQAYPT
jgi:hypothetical protein